jgi:hypothetical protein
VHPNKNEAPGRYNIIGFAPPREFLSYYAEAIPAVVAHYAAHAIAEQFRNDCIHFALVLRNAHRFSSARHARFHEFSRQVFALVSTAAIEYHFNE